MFSLFLILKKLSLCMVKKKPSYKHALLYCLHLSLGHILFFISLTCSLVCSFEQQFTIEIPGLISEENHSGLSKLSLDESTEF